MTYFDFMRVVNYKRNENDYCPIAAARLLEEVKERDMKILENEKIKLGWVKEEKAERVERVVEKMESFRKEIDVTSIKPLPKKEEGVVKVERKIEKIDNYQPKKKKSENLSNGVNVKSIFPEIFREMGNSMLTFAKKITERPKESGIDKGEVKKQISYNLTSDNDDKEDFVLVIDTNILVIFCAFLFIFLLIVI